MSFVIVSAPDVLYGPTALSTEDSVLHEQLTSSNQVSHSLTMSRRRRRRDRGEKYDKILRKYESKLAECKDRHNEHKAEKLREKIEGMVERKKERIALQEETKVNFDLNGKSIVFKVEDAPVRVLNQLAALGYSVMPSAGGSGSSGHGHGHGNFVWTLFKPGYVPTPIYPELNLSSTD